MNKQKLNSPTRTKHFVLSAFAGILTLVLSQAAQAFFPSLNLTTGTPDIESAFINVVYTGNDTTGTLTADGTALLLTPPGAPTGQITTGVFDLDATINNTAMTAMGTLRIGGTIAGLGFNSGTLLTGTFSSTMANQTFGAGAGDPLEFLFSVTGGDAAGLFSTGTFGTILSQSGYTGMFANDFVSAPFGGLADTFGPPPVPEPSVLGLMFLGGGLLAYRRRKLPIANYS